MSKPVSTFIPPSALNLGSPIGVADGSVAEPLLRSPLSPTFVAELAEALSSNSPTFMNMMESPPSSPLRRRFQIAVTKAVEREAQRVKAEFVPLLTEEAKRLYPEFSTSVITVEDLAAESRGTNPHKIITMTNEDDGTQKKLHAKRVGSHLIMPNKFCEILVYKVLEKMGYGPTSYAAFFPEQPHSLVTITEDVLSAERYKHRGEPGYNPGDHQFYTMSDLEKWATVRDELGAIAADFSTKVGKRLFRGEEESLKQSISDEKMMQLLNSKECLEHSLAVDLIANLLGLTDLRKNRGNWGLLTVVTGDHPDRLKTVAKPIIIDFGLMDPRDHPRDAASSLRDIPSGLPSATASKRLFDGSVMYQCDDATSSMVEGWILNGKQEEGINRPNFATAVEEALTYTLDFIQDLVERGLLDEDIARTSTPQSRSVATQNAPDDAPPKSPSAQEATERMILETLYRNHDTEGVISYKEKVMRDLEYFKEACQRREFYRRAESTQPSSGASLS
jgi:hypothetical protein